MIALPLTAGRYERLEQISWWRQDLLAGAQVLVAGAGALGNEILKNLALLGVGRIAVVDSDRVELSNLSRSLLFRASDVGQPKAEVAASRLRELNPDVRVLPLVGDLRWVLGLGLLRRMDVVLAGLDSAASRLDLNQMCWKAGVPWVDGALNWLSGTMRFFAPPESACFECSLSQRDYQHLSARFSCGLLPRDVAPTQGTPTTPTAAALVAAWQVQEAVKWLHGHTVAGGRGLSYDAMTHDVRRITYRRRAACLAHESLGEVVPVAGASCRETVGSVLAMLRRTLGEEVVIELDREVVLAMSCPRCGSRTTAARPLFALNRRAALCPSCGAERHLHLTHFLDTRAALCDLRLDALGVPPLHILAARHVQDGRRWGCELTADAEAEPLADFLKPREGSDGDS